MAGIIENAQPPFCAYARSSKNPEGTDDEEQQTCELFLES